MAWGCMRCAQLRAAQMITKKWHGQPDRGGPMRYAQLWAAQFFTKKRRGKPNRNRERETERQRDRETERQRHWHISSTRPNWGTLSRCWTHTLEINTNTKIAKVSRTTGQTDIFYWHSGYLIPWPEAACVALNYGPHKWSPKSDTDNRIERQRCIETYGHIILTEPRFVTLDTSVGINISWHHGPPHW